MPRIATSLLRKAFSINRLLPPLLAPCRSLDAAKNELRWLHEHAENIANGYGLGSGKVTKRVLLKRWIQQRAIGKPLQYLLGTEYFGGLEIVCRPGVLIPRPDTATYTTRLVSLLQNSQNLPHNLRVLDLCTGTGCIPLLFHHELSAAREDVRLHLLGADISGKSMKLAKYNLHRYLQGRKNIKHDEINFIKADILLDSSQDPNQESISFEAALKHNNQPRLWDILVSNPPYISPSAYWRTTARSVRGFEPKLALVPPFSAGYDDTQQGDCFYPRLFNIAKEMEAKIVLFEIADMDQALRVARMAKDLNIFDEIEIWREQPHAMRSQSTSEKGFQELHGLEKPRLGFSDEKGHKFEFRSAVKQEVDRAFQNMYPQI